MVFNGLNLNGPANRTDGVGVSLLIKFDASKGYMSDGTNFAQKYPQLISVTV